jgi:hypothetical protein
MRERPAWRIVLIVTVTARGGVMHARVQVVRNLPKQFESEEAVGYLLDVLRRHPGFRHVHLMQQIGSRRSLNVTFWDSQADADAAPERTQAVLGPRPFPLDYDEVYAVIATSEGPADVADATVCQVSWFDGPRSAAQNEAMRRAGEERIDPVIRAVAGHAATYVLCHPADSGVVLLTLATSTTALEDLAQAVFSTSLLPDEDPSLLDGPDRVEVYKLEAATLPVLGAPIRAEHG